MKSLFYLFLMAFMSGIITAQPLPDLPTAVAAATAEVRNDTIYVFGGAADWNGTLLNHSVYRFDGTSWSEVDSIPDDNLWAVQSVLVGEEVYLLSGWPGTGTLTRKYHLTNHTWTILAPSPNNRPWGTTAQGWNEFIYLFQPSGDVYEYDTVNNSWLSKSRNSQNSTFGMCSAVWQDDIYVAGFHDSTFYKYTPLTDEWTQLAGVPKMVVAGSMAAINGQIYCVGGGSSEQPLNPYRTLLVYDVLSDTWIVDRFEISHRRQWMASVIYQNELHVIGGFDSSWSAVNIVENVLPQGPLTAIIDRDNSALSSFRLSQNYPNPFNPVTNVEFAIRNSEFVNLAIYDLSGRHVKTLVNKRMVAGSHLAVWDGTNEQSNAVASGVYFYRLTWDNNISLMRKMILLR